MTLLNRKNVAGGGESRIWTLDQPTGNYHSECFGVLNESKDQPKDFFWDNSILNQALTTPWETILFNDRKVKHEARAFVKGRESIPCSRDVLVNFVRKPLANGIDMKMGPDGKKESII